MFCLWPGELKRGSEEKDEVWFREISTEVMHRHRRDL